MIFCKHEWKMLSETVTESPYEHSIKILRAHGGTSIKNFDASTERKHIQTFTCDKCGNLKRFVEEI